jgi:hypothetical protein
MMDVAEVSNLGFNCPTTSSSDHTNTVRDLEPDAEVRKPLLRC